MKREQQNLLLIGGAGVLLYALWRPATARAAGGAPGAGTTGTRPPSSTGGGGGGTRPPGSGTGPISGSNPCGAGYVDVQDPCDPCSASFDTTICEVIGGTPGPYPPNPCGANYLDVQDPCDPCSFSYDETICEVIGGTPGGKVGIEDPCDPLSIAWDYQACYGLPPANGAGLPDSGDPCDPLSTAYDYWACYGAPTNGATNGAAAGGAGDPWDPLVGARAGLGYYSLRDIPPGSLFGRAPFMPRRSLFGLGQPCCADCASTGGRCV